MSDASIIQAPHTLKKARIGNGPAALDPKLLERAEKVVKSMEKDYTAWAQDDLAALESSFARLCANPGEQSAHMREMFRIALDMKGQGASFGYKLITEIGDLLSGFLEDRTSLAGLECEAVAAHLAAMRAVFAQDVRGDGGEIGRQLVGGLRKLIEKAQSEGGRAARKGS